jgi:replication factor A1
MAAIPDTIADIYEKLRTAISEEEFLEKVRLKVESMAGLCDERTAAFLVAHELGVDIPTVVQIADIGAQRGMVAFTGKVVSVSPVREFNRGGGGAGDTGHVVNIAVADETGSINVALWDDLAQHAAELKVGQLLSISGTVKRGRYGVEVTAREVHVEEPDHTAGAEEAPTAAAAAGRGKIADLLPGTTGVTITGFVLDIGTPRTFPRRDGTTGTVNDITIGDETGRIRVILWDDQADVATHFSPGDVLKVENGYTRERYGRCEVHVGPLGKVEKSAERVDVVEKVTHVADVALNVPCTIDVVVVHVDPLREFTRSDGSTGTIRDIVVRDKTGEIGVVLWGDKATAIGEGDVGQRFIIRDCMPRSGLTDQLELSVDWRSSISAG